ncbi:hypothetical protein V8D89_014422 [Ganoderma adspersum]
MTLCSKNSFSPPSFDPFVAARNHPAVLNPGLATPVSNPSAPLPDSFAAACNYAGVVPSVTRAGSPPSLYVNPFAATHNFPSQQATILGTHVPVGVALQNFVRAQDRAGTSSHLLHTMLKAERQQVDCPREEAPLAKKAKVNNTIPVGSHLEAFLKCAIVVQNDLLARKACPTPLTECPSSCGKKDSKPPFKPPFYRCFDCYHAPIVWEPELGFWQHHSLSLLKNFILNLGHGSKPCNVTNDMKDPVPDMSQLLRFGLFPGSWDVPWSAFSINGLRDYHLLSLYMDNSVPAETKDQSHELNNMMREFTFLQATRRAGVQPTQDLLEGSLSMLCPACPQPFKNMNLADQDKCLENEKYLDMFFHTVDSNFHSTQKMKPIDPSDFLLTKGGGYYAEEEFSCFEKDFKPPKKEPTTSHKFGVMGYSRFGGRISGTHEFAYVDYCICSGLAPYFTLCRHCSGYNINCQYRIYFKSRIMELQEQFPTLSTCRILFFPYTLPGIGKFHAPAHTSSCHTAYSYNFLPGVGMMDREALEQIWSIFNSLTLRTKEISSGHCHDVINDFHSNMNVCRLQAMPTTLSDHYTRAIEHKEHTADHLAALEDTIGDTATLAHWQRRVNEWVERVLHREEETVLEESPYKIGQAFWKTMTDRELLTKIMQERSVSSQSTIGMLSVIQDGLALQQDRHALLDHLGSAMESNKGVTLDAALTHQSQDTLGTDFPMRDVSEDAAGKQGEAWADVWDVILPLPSSYVYDVLRKHSISEPVTIEQNLCCVAADHALEDLRTALMGVRYLQLDKHSKQCKTHTTRAQGKIQTTQHEADKATDEYCRHKTALLALGMEPSDPQYQALGLWDVVPFSMASNHTTVGQSHQWTSWIWENFVFAAPEEGEGNFTDFHKEGKVTTPKEEEAGNLAHRYVHLLALCAENFQGAFEVDTLLTELD